MFMNRKTGFTLFFLFLAGIFALYAQEKQDAPAPRKVCIFLFPDISPATDKTGDAVFFQSAIKENLVFELKDAGFDIVDDVKILTFQKQLKITNMDLVDGAKAMQLASAATGDVAITGFFRLEENRILFGVKCYDVLSNRLAVTVLKDGRAGASLSNLIHDAINEIIPLIQEKIPPLASLGKTIEREIPVIKKIVIKKSQEKGKRIKLTFQSNDENAQIFFADHLIGEIKEGSFEIPAKASSKLVIEVKKENFHAVVKTVDLGEEDMTIKLDPLVRENQFALDGEYACFQFFGVGGGFRWYPVSDWLYLRASEYFFLQLGGPSTSPVIHNDINVSVSLYLIFGPESLFRLGFLTGAGVILTNFTAPNLPFSTDYYWDCLGMFMELNFGEWSYFLKETGRYFLGFGDNLLGTGWNRPWPVNLSVGVVKKW
jgi:hypothetical protein